MRIRAITIPPIDPSAPTGRYDDAPAALAQAGLYETLRTEGADVVGPVGVPALDPATRSEDAVTNIAQLGARIADAVASGLTANSNVLITGSNCTALVGVLAGFEKAFGPTARIGLVWFDAHGDFNTPKTTLSGMIGGMPVAVSAGLAFPHWRQITGLDAPIPTDRIVMVDVRNLDAAERTLIEATDVTIAAIETGRPGVPLQEAIDRLAAECDVIYLHIDEDVLDARYVPNHGTVEPNGPDMDATLNAIRLVLRTGKVRGYGLVSINVNGEGGKESLESGLELLTKGIAAWHQPGATA
jgi:arginase